MIQYIIYSIYTNYLHRGNCSNSKHYGIHIGRTYGILDVDYEKTVLAFNESKTD